MSASSSSKFSQGCRLPFDEHNWIVQIRRQIYDEDIEEDDSTAVCIFKISKILSHYVPELYTPSQVSIGPYHYLNDELYEMERFKLSAAKNVRKKLQCSTFDDLVEEIIKLESKIRVSYNTFLHYTSETLGWMMSIDACFVLEFIEAYGLSKDTTFDREFSKIPPRLVDYKGRKLAHNIILQDLAMLENQIPLFVLRKVLEFQQPLGKVERNLDSMLMNLCKALSPFCWMETLSSMPDSFHLLDFLYRLITATLKENSEIVRVQEEEDVIRDLETGDEPMSSIVTTISNWSCKVVSVLFGYVATLPKKVMTSRLTKVVTKLSWKIVSTIPMVSMVKQTVEVFMSTADNEEANQPVKNGSSDIETALMIQEITIPSVSELIGSGIRFLPTNGGIHTLCYDAKENIIYLPKIYVDVHTEVVLRNLISYEMLVNLGPMMLSRYTELMNGIIDTDEDVRLLRENGIIVNRLESDSEVAHMWNRMRIANKYLQVPLLDKVIEEVNKYYGARWKNKFKKIINFDMLDPWKVLLCLGVIFFVLFMIIQMLFSIYKFFQLYGARII